MDDRKNNGMHASESPHIAPPLSHEERTSLIDRAEKAELVNRAYADQMPYLKRELTDTKAENSKIREKLSKTRLLAVKLRGALRAVETVPVYNGGDYEDRCPTCDWLVDVCGHQPDCHLASCLRIRVYDKPPTVRSGEAVEWGAYQDLVLDLAEEEAEHRLTLRAYDECLTRLERYGELISAFGQMEELLRAALSEESLDEETTRDALSVVLQRVKQKRAQTAPVPMGGTRSELEHLRELEKLVRSYFKEPDISREIELRHQIRAVLAKLVSFHSVDGSKADGPHGFDTEAEETALEITQEETEDNSGDDR